MGRIYTFKSTTQANKLRSAIKLPGLVGVASVRDTEAGKGFEPLSQSYRWVTVD